MRRIAPISSYFLQHKHNGQSPLKRLIEIRGRGREDLFLERQSKIGLSKLLQILDATSVSFYASILLIMSAKAGLVIKTPVVMPIIVVNANPLNKPAPAHQRGNRETTEVK